MPETVSMQSVLFLGTASCFPTPSRGVSCSILKWSNGQMWMFDCGEGSQIQIQKSNAKASKVNKIFITHLHGDHLFGLPGLLCTLGNNAPQDKKVEVYGPLGVKKYVETSLLLSQSFLDYNCTFHELVPREDQYADGNYVKDLVAAEAEAPNTRILYDESLKGWQLMTMEASGVSVVAGAIQHRIPSFAYIIQEKAPQRSLLVDKVKALGLQPSAKYSDLKHGRDVTLDDGTVIRSEDVTVEARRAKKVAVLGDTCDTREIVDFCLDCDLVVHEATMENSLREKCVSFGHSTPEMAADFAAKTRCKKLCLTHVSPRYKPISAEEEGKEDEASTARTLLDEAKARVAELEARCEVDIAEDFHEVKL